MQLVLELHGFELCVHLYADFFLIVNTVAFHSHSWLNPLMWNYGYRGPTISDMWIFKCGRVSVPNSGVFPRGILLIVRLILYTIFFRKSCQLNHDMLLTICILICHVQTMKNTCLKGEEI